jgi:DNA-binding CsgD family transcriptional regulator
VIREPVATAGREGELVGREAELDRLDAFIADRASLPAAVIIEGQAGAGKTTLWRATVERARAAGYRVLACRPAGAEIQLADSALSDLLEPHLGEVLAFLPPPQRRALEIALLIGGDEGRPPDRRAIAAGFLNALRALAREQAVLLAVDDAQWLDDASAEVLEYGIRRLQNEPVAILTAWRTGSPTVGVDGHGAGLRLDRALSRSPIRLEVGPMSLGALHRLLRTRTSLQFNRRTLQRIHETSGGNPFYALELARAMERSEETPDLIAPGTEPLRLSASLEQLLAERLRDLPEATRDALFVAAALSQPTVGVVAGAIGAAPTAASEALRPAARAGIVRAPGGSEDPVEFVHPLFAAAAYAAMNPGDRRRWHVRIAEAAQDTETKARHLALARPGPDAEVAHLLHDAATRANGRGAVGDAAELLTEAIGRLPPDGPDPEHERAEWIVQAAPLLMASGATDAARALVESALEHEPSGLTRSDLLFWQVELIESEPGAGNRQIELIEQALVEAGTDQRRRAAALLNREMLERSTGGLERALPIARQALAAAEASGDQAWLAAAHVRTADLETILGLAEDPVARFQTALELDARIHVDAKNGAKAMLAVCLIRAGRLDEARPLLESALGRAMAEGDESSFGHVSLFLAELEWLAGRWDAAAAIAAEGLEVSERAGNRLAEGMDLILVALVEASRGDPARARDLSLRAISVTDEIVDVGYWSYARQGLAFLELSLGHAAAALGHLETFRIGFGIEGPKRIAFIGDAIEALVQLGDVDRAAALTEEVAGRGAELHRPPLTAMAARCRALVQATRGELEAAIVEAQASAETFHQLGHPFEHARSLLVLGEIQRRAKQRRAARETLTAATAAFDRLGAHLWSKRAEAERARVGGRSTIEGLTETEARVAALVAEGKSNKEVAAELFVTVRAVEANLSKVYAKLGVRSRTELARRI